MDQAWITIKALRRGFGDSPRIRRLATVCPSPLTFEPKINRLRQTIDDYYWAKFQVIQIRCLRFIVLTYTSTHPQTHTHTSWQSDRYITTSSARIIIVHWTEQSWCVQDTEMRILTLHVNVKPVLHRSRRIFHYLCNSTDCKPVPRA